MTDRFRILVVDEDRLSRLTTAQEIQKMGFEAEPVDNAYLALQHLATAPWDVVIADLGLTSLDGLEFLRQVRDRYPAVAVIVTASNGRVETAVAAMQAGAADCLVKPLRPEDLALRLRQVRELATTRSTLAALRLAGGDAEHGLIGRCPAMLEVMQKIQSFADHDAPVLVTGESGTGKELVARALHQQGRRRNRPFLSVACGAQQGDLADAALFGCEKGTLPATPERRIGCLERAHEGTLLLDDVDQLPLGLQVKLLGLLQDGSFLRFGGTEEVRVNVRVIATSAVDLAQAVKDGTFRDDLFYRLRGLEIALPRLAERGDDVLLLAQHFLRVPAGRTGNGHGKLTLSAEAARRLREYRWPGNVRELRRAMESAAIVAAGGEIRPEHLPAFLSREAHGHNEMFSLHLDRLDRVPFNELLERFQDELIRWALGRAGGQQKRAADLLGIPRTTLQSRMLRLRSLARPPVECHT